VTPPVAAPLVGSPPPPPTATPLTPTKTYDTEHHLAGKPAAIVDLFERLDAIGLSLGPDLARRPTKMYVGYYVGKWWAVFTAVVQKAKILVYINIPPSRGSALD
jgi:Domain of unknown function (DUF5655)